MVTVAEKDVFVGPRPIEFGEPFYGRDREIAELTCQLVSERVVLLHAPSGAGKTSLIQAGLIPELREEGFEIPMTHSPVVEDGAAPRPLLVRVNRPPEEKDDPGANRYVLSVLTALEQTQPPEKRRPPEALQKLTLDNYLSDCAAKRLLLIFDQFEEILTLDPTDESAKREFFRQLGAVLQTPDETRSKCRWSLFALREDYLAAAEPFFGPLPRRLGVQYRLGFLRKEPAIEAIRKTAARANVEFPAANRLVANLLNVSVQRPDGTMQIKEGSYVEPVLLQVVCRRLWDSLPPGTTVIDEKTLGQDFAGGVDKVLQEYFDEAVKKAAAVGKISERRIRRWFAEQLNRNEIRHSVPLGSEAAHGINALCLQELDRAFLIRKEARAGIFWIELSHDRLIKPIADANAAFAQTLTTFQKQARLWAEQNKPHDLLVTGIVLEEGEKLVNQNANDATNEEKSFLKACKNAVAEKDLRKKNTELRRRNQRLGWGIVGLALLASVLTLGGLYQETKEELNTQRKDFTKKSDEDKSAFEAKFKNQAKKSDITSDKYKRLLSNAAKDANGAAFLRGFLYELSRDQTSELMTVDNVGKSRDFSNDISERLRLNRTLWSLNSFVGLASNTDGSDPTSVIGAIKLIESEALGSDDENRIFILIKQLEKLQSTWQKKTTAANVASTRPILETILFSLKSLRLHLRAVKANSSLVLQFTPIMQFGLRERGKERRCLTYAADGFTNSTKIAINGKPPILFGSKDGVMRSVLWDLGNGKDGLPRIATKCEWQPRKSSAPKDDLWPILIRQEVEIIRGDSKKLDTCRVEYEIVSEMRAACNVRFWTVVDTMIDKNDANLFSWQIGAETQYSDRSKWVEINTRKGKQVPDYLTAIDKKTDPTMTCYFSFNVPPLARPDGVFIFGKREDALNDDTKSHVAIGEPGADSHVKIEWRLGEESELAARETRRIGFAYGLGKLPREPKAN